MAESESESRWFADPELLLRELRDTESMDAAGGTPPLIPGYQDLCELMRGGQGVVYSATQVSTGRRVAIKVLLAGELASAESRQRFQREIALAAALRHPGIVRVYDSGATASGKAFLVMELVEGVPLDQFVRERCMSVGAGGVRAVVELLVKVCAAVAHAHQKGVIHRDLKPDNIRVDAQGEPHVLDFGLARQEHDAAQPPLSRSGEFLGSLPWASPEQASGKAHLADVRTDVYALGVVLHHALTDRFPYDVTGSLRDVLERIERAAPTRPSSIVHAIDSDLETIVLRCLAKDPERRYQTVHALERDLIHWLAGKPIEAKADSTLYVLRKLVARHRLAASAVLAMIVLLTGFGITMSVLWQKADHAEQLAVGRLEQVEKAKQKAEQEVEQNVAIAAYLSRMFATASGNYAGADVKVVDVVAAAAAELEQKLPSPHVEAAVRYALASILYELDLLEAALPHAERAFALRREIYGDHLHTVEAGKLLARLWRRNGQLDKAIPVLRGIVALCQRLVGASARATLGLRNDLASALLLHGELGEAELVLRAVLAEDDGTIGEMASTMANLAEVLTRLDKPAEAEALQEQALARARAQFPEDHFQRLRSETAAAQFYSRRGAHDRAEPLFEHVYSITRDRLGRDSARATTALVDLAACRLELGNLDYSERALRAVCRTLEGKEPRDAKLLGRARALLEEVLRRR